MADVVIAQKQPYFVDVVAGKEYYWCACGRSSRQPFCDGSHKDTGITPQLYTATETKSVMFCGCKHSKRKPICDGSHNRV